MKSNKLSLWAILLLISTSGFADAKLIDYGSTNEMFFDSTLNRYYYDPHEFQGQTRAEVDVWLANHPNWRYAAPNEISQLLSNDLPIGDPTGTDWMIMGEPTSKSAYQTAGGSIRYSYDWGGWMTYIPTDDTFFPHYDHEDWAAITMRYNVPSAGLDETYVDFYPGYDYGEYAIGGAWLVTDIDPISTPVPAPLLLLCSGVLGLSTFKRRRNLDS